MHPVYFHQHTLAAEAVERPAGSHRASSLPEREPMLQGLQHSPF